MVSNILFGIIGQIIFVIIIIAILIRFKVTGQKTALAGFILLFITMLFSLIHKDDMAGIVAEYVWILFAIAFVQEFIHFLKHEN
jgi:hypothetical protein